MVFLIFLLGLGAQEGLENDPEVRGVILTEFGPKRSHLDPVQAHFYSLWAPDLFCDMSPNVSLGL